MGLLRIMDPMHGDQQTVFNPADPVSLDAAVKLFNETIEKNGGPDVVPVFKKGANGQHEKVKGFDPTADEILVTRQLGGG